MTSSRGLKALEEKLRLKIDQARMNGFDVVPYYSEARIKNYDDGVYVSCSTQQCCLIGAANDLTNSSESWVPDGIEDGFECKDLAETEKNRNPAELVALGFKLCLEYLKNKSSEQKSQPC